MPELPREEIIRRYEAGESVAALARVYDVRRDALRTQLKDWGVRVRDRAEAARLRGQCGPQPVIPPRRPRVR